MNRNNCVEQNHRNIKRRIAIETGFKEIESVQRTLTGIHRQHYQKESKH